MTVLGIQFLCIITLFLSTATAFLLPYFLIGRKSDLFDKFHNHVGLSFANCISGGIFIATFFVGLMPEVRKMFVKIFKMYSIHSAFPITELVVFLGFILALSIEQCFIIYQEKKKSQDISLLAINNDEEEILYPKSEKYTDDVYISSNYNNDVATQIPSKVLKNFVTELDLNSAQIQENEYNTHKNVCSGHCHTDISHYLKDGTGLRLGMLVISFGIHSLFEGLAIGLQTSKPLLLNLMIGVVIHELVIAFAIGVNVSSLKLSKSTTFQFAFLYSSAIPVGQLIGTLVGHYHSRLTIILSAILQGLATGTFIHVTFLEVIPAEFQKSSYRLLKVFFIGLGFALQLSCFVIHEIIVK